MDRYTTVGNVAERFGVSDETVRRWLEAGLLKGFRLPSGHRRILVSDVEALENRLIEGFV